MVVISLYGGYIPLLNKNTDIYNVGMDAGKSLSDLIPTMFTWTRGSFDAFIWMGGSGCTIALLIAIFIFSKRDDNRAVAKLSFPMGCFNINEPVIFGLPIVLNPILMIPFVLAPLVNTAIGALEIFLGLVPAGVLDAGWATPQPIKAFLSTSGAWQSIVSQILAITVATLIYLPFVIAANKAAKQEKKEETQA